MNWPELLPLVVLVAAFSFLVLRPVKARQREALAIRSALAVGQRVMTASGLHATVVALEGDDVVVLEIAPGLHTRWARAAVATISPSETEAAESTAAEPTAAEGTAAP
jgi:preprotein translocase subunit YajC